MKRTKYILLPFVILVLFVLSSCKKDELKIYKLEISSETVVKGTTSAEITVNYVYPTSLKHVDGYVSTMSAMTVANKATATIDGKAFVVKFQDLAANTTYYYQFEYSNGVDEIFTEVKSFTTNDYSLPTVTTNDVTNITAISAICGGNITDNGDLEITARGVCWSTNQNPTINDFHTFDGSGTGTFTSSLSSLDAQTTYYVRAYATNNKGIGYGEQKTFITQDGLPVVATSYVSGITTESAICGGNVTSDGGFEVITRGVCWSTSQNPTIDHSHTTNGTGTGSFEGNLIDLNNNTTYYVRAYAINSKGIAYGDVKSFRTLIIVPEGAFSVGAYSCVYFSNGNLQYQASTDTWRFAENQWDFVGTQTPDPFGNSGGTVSGSDNAMISDSYSGWIDMYGWGTGKNPTNTSVNNSMYSIFKDWGNNTISNGGNISSWRTLTNDEWEYLLNTRSTDSGIRFAKATVNGVKGVVILPDNWSSSAYDLINTNQVDVGFDTNTITSVMWTSVFEDNGAVFLPAGGTRTANSVYHPNVACFYWSSTAEDNGGARSFYVSNSYWDSSFFDDRSHGQCVRLVRDTQ